MQDEHIFEHENVISVTECTGLFPALPVNDPRSDAELASLQAVLPPKKRNGRRVEGNDRRKPHDHKR